MRLDNEQIAIIVMFTIGVLLCCLLLPSCRTTQPVVVERVKVDSVYMERLRVDSVYIHDSTFIEARKDTFYLYKYKILERYQILRDTAYICRIDSVPVIKEVETVRTENSKFAKFCMWWFWIVIVLAVLYTAWKIVKRYYLRMP